MTESGNHDTNDILFIYVTFMESHQVLRIFLGQMSHSQRVLEAIMDGVGIDMM